ncbi:hypothetical protein VUR80DRAFT_9324 [Thermomyces stellatus]
MVALIWGIELMVSMFWTDANELYWTTSYTPSDIRRGEPFASAFDETAQEKPQIYPEPDPYRGAIARHHISCPNFGPTSYTSLGRRVPTPGDPDPDAMYPLAVPLPVTRLLTRIGHHSHSAYQDTPTLLGSCMQEPPPGCILRLQPPLPKTVTTQYRPRGGDG